jgi:hypothetical protein
MRLQAGLVGAQAGAEALASRSFEVRPRWPLETC